MGILFFAIWIILNGRITVEIVVFGLAVAAVLYLFLVKVFHYRWQQELKLLRNFPLMLYYVLNLIREVIAASCATAAKIWKKEKCDAVFIEFHSGFDDSISNVLLANSITLTPGTYTVALEGDHFLIACLSPEFAEGIEESSFVRILRRMK